MVELKDKVATGIALPIMEQFYTIQGEGSHQGKAAYFIRVGGCDVGCVWCDVKDSWEAGNFPVDPIGKITDAAAAHPSKLVVVTGGEPLMYEMGPLTEMLHAKGFDTHIETAGAHTLTGDWDWICLSPKKFKPPLPENCSQAHELKVIIFNASDFKWAEEYAQKASQECVLFLQPEWSKKEKIMPLIIEYVKMNPKWNISLQTHKYMDIP